MANSLLYGQSSAPQQRKPKYGLLSEAAGWIQADPDSTPAAKQRQSVAPTQPAQSSTVKPGTVLPGIYGADDPSGWMIHNGQGWMPTAKPVNWQQPGTPQAPQTSPSALLGQATQALDQGRSGVAGLISQVQQDTGPGAAAAARAARDRAALGYLDRESDARRSSLLYGVGAGNYSADRAANDFTRYAAREAMDANQADRDYRQQSLNTQRQLLGDMMGAGQQYGALSGVSRANELQPYAVDEARITNEINRLDLRTRASLLDTVIKQGLNQGIISDIEAASARQLYQRSAEEWPGWLKSLIRVGLVGGGALAGGLLTGFNPLGFAAGGSAGASAAGAF